MICAAFLASSGALAKTIAVNNPPPLAPLCTVNSCQVLSIDALGNCTIQAIGTCGYNNYVWNWTTVPSPAYADDSAEGCKWAAIGAGCPLDATSVNTAATSSGIGGR